ncbi:potassium channel family protein [Lichenibacterium dinghuense]|uniref:potassium channel family protein n=1 Tax=Lichenibacterium dinghuense TaxID=2895977 RepID=UPI001F1A2C0C|nr:potassium channel family protein [Lichenibacterium sp. 6Y81]
MSEGSILSGMGSPRMTIPRSWREGSLTALLVVQAVVVFVVVPAIASGLPLPSGLTLLVLLGVMCATCILTNDRLAPLLGGIMLPLSAATLALQLATANRIAQIAGEATGLLTFLLLGIVVFRAVFSAGRFSGHRIRGAVVLYLNTGLSFAFVHRLLAQALPNAYDHVPPSEQVAAFWAALDYFSFSTLTALGPGDIVPLQPIARGAAVLESTLGQLLPTVLIARVVTLATSQADAPSETNESDAHTAQASRSMRQ